MDIVALLESYNVSVSEEFFSEFLEIVDSSGCKEQILRDFVRYLYMLSNIAPGVLCQNNKHFEKLKGYPNLYSLRIITNLCNLRVIYSYNSDGKILLHSFEERSGKKASDYRGHIPIALKRLHKE